MLRVKDIKLIDLYTVIHISDSSIHYILNASDDSQNDIYDYIFDIPNYDIAKVTSIRIDGLGDMDIYFTY